MQLLHQENIKNDKLTEFYCLLQLLLNVVLLQALEILAAVVTVHSLPRLPLSGAASVGAPNIVLLLSCNDLD